jgi:glucan phosphoethanolaminetransferase (alkaline phosphatase superfamily)
MKSNVGHPGFRDGFPSIASVLWYGLSRPWWVTFGCCLLLDVVSFFGPRRPSVELNARLYFYGLAMSLAFFQWVGVVYRLTPLRAQKALGCVLALFFFVTMSVNALVYREFGQYLTRSMLQFMEVNPRYFEDYSFTYLFRLSTLAGVLALGVLLYLWYPKRPSWGGSPPGAASFRQAPTRFWFIHLPLAYVLATIFLTPQTSGTLMPVIPATVSALAVSRPPARSELHYAANRAKVAPASTEASPPNVLIIASESWGKPRGLPFYGSSVNAMPFLSDWIEKDPGHFIVWRSGFTSSTATDVSLPSLVTGVEPDESARKLHEMPLLWQWGKASGAYTFYLTSVRLGFGRLDQFFNCKERDATFGADNLNSPIVHEAGIDDIVVAGKVRDILASKPARQRFVGMVFTNALHSPFQDRSAMIAQMPPFEGRYEKAAYIVDRAIQVIVNALREQGLLDNTVIFFTADHGESPAPSHTAHRIFSYYDEFFNIPYLVYVPERWKASHPALYTAFKANEIQNVSNLDILPTVVDLLGLTGSNAGLVDQFKGESLVRPVNARRLLVGLSTNDVRTWEQEGLGLAWGPYRFVCSNVDGPRFFDLVTDPAEQRDRWPTLDQTQKRVVLRAIHSSYHLARVCGMAQ